MVANKKAGGKPQPADESRSSETPLEPRDWDDAGIEEVEPEDLPRDEPLIADLELLEEREQDISDDDDDNAYQESDEALPDDAEEAAIRGFLAG